MEKIDTASAVYASAALNFLNGYVAISDQLNDIDEIGEWVAASPYVTENYKAAIKSEINDYNNDPEAVLDANLILTCQDCPDDGSEFELYL